jgi:hypothetical protein
MKRFLLLFIPLMGFFGCEVFDNNDDSPNTSYNCTNDECFSAEGGSGQYATLDDCLSICGNNNDNNNDDFSNAVFCLEIDIDCNINGRYIFSQSMDLYDEDFWLTGENTSATIEPDCVEDYFGSPYQYSIEFIDMDEVGGCTNIEVRVFKDDVLYVTNNHTLGCIEIDFTTPGNTTTYCNIYCGTNGNSVQQSIEY